MKKNKLKGVAIAVVAVAAIAGIGYSLKGDGRAKPEGEIVAKINGKPVYSSEADEQLSAMVRGQQGADKATFNMLDEKAKLLVIKELAANKLILENAYKADAEDADNVKQKVIEYQDKLAKEEFLTSMAKDAVTEDKIKARYDELVKELEGKTQYKVRHILVKSQAAAESAEKSLESESFEAVAKKRSLDEGSVLTGGDLGYLIEGNMIKEFEDNIKKMKDGEVSKPFKTQFGWHIIKLEGRRAAVADPFESVKNRLAQEMFAETIQTYVKGIVEKTDIELVAVADKDAAKEEKAEEKAEEKTKEAPAEPVAVPAENGSETKE